MKVKKLEQNSNDNLVENNQESEWSEHLDGYQGNDEYSSVTPMASYQKPNENSESNSTRSSFSTSSLSSLSSLSMIRSMVENPLLLVAVGVSTAVVASQMSLITTIGNKYRVGLITSLDDPLHWCLYLLWCVSMGLLSCVITQNICPEAVGGGLPEMKTILSGVIKPVLLSKRMLVSKCLGLCFALVCGISVGMEGPLVHISAIIADQLMQLPILKYTTPQYLFTSHLIASHLSSPSNFLLNI